jgi:hypothetical protein
MLAALALGLLQTSRPDLSGDWIYVARSSSGTIVARGAFAVRRELEVERRGSRRPKGGWVASRKVTQLDIKRFGPHSEQAHPQEMRKLNGEHSELSLRESPDRAHFELDGTHFTADLNEGWFDDNIWLDGRLKGSTIAGVWKWATFAGYRAKGTFTLSRAR